MSVWNMVNAIIFLYLALLFKLYLCWYMPCFD